MPLLVLLLAFIALGGRVHNCVWEYDVWMRMFVSVCVCVCVCACVRVCVRLFIAPLGLNMDITLCIQIILRHTSLFVYRHYLIKDNVI